MPISRDEFEHEPSQSIPFGPSTQPRTVLQFLLEHPETAYTQTELADETGIQRGSLGKVLSRLESHDLVRHRDRYWIIADDDRLASVSAASTGLQSVADTYDDDWYAQNPDWADDFDPEQDAWTPTDHDSPTDTEDEG
ncbi:MarR family transcriptional regulator [Halococcus salifodinae]|uniref:HTH marR-type domain-containing protein n=1 Tax=Halococcus salifodinae DSM 8989 TaxID=1227456 RepID=M0MSU0_9EURY|nr:helix-turn-helix domain-containing protein [Halococcus salifodinae]EMA47819.1 hypothetical protein C450_20911 [Halococcus salifodinae DSM 8989]